GRLRVVGHRRAAGRLVIMRPARLELVPYSLRFRELYATARGQLSDRQLLLVRIGDESGTAGLGEAAPLALRGGPGVEKIARELRESCWPLLEGREIEAGAIGRTLAACRARGASLQALAALDIALHDLAGKLAGKPVWMLLGAAEVRPVRCNATLPAGNPSNLRRLASRWAERGFSTYKLKVGMAGDIQQVGHVRAAVGAEAELRVDANASWRAEEAVQRLRAMVAHRLEIVEQPAPALEDLAEVRRRTGLRIGADESVVEAADARRAAKLEACEIATVKLAKCGGMLATLEIAAEIPVYLSSALDGPVGIAAAAHTAQAIDDAGVAHGLATSELFAETIASRGAALNRDLLSVPEGPGLGIEIDEELLAARRT
ncbi:MAG: mandelate racemase/muconate lactonizing enzyme family protein, partial [Solirubrobacterales bacterium]